MVSALLGGWRSGRSAVGVWCSSRDSLVAESVASVKPDYVCIDMQHGASNFGNLVEMLQAVRSGGSAAVVRVPENSLALINKALDAGADGIIVPLVETVDGARRAVEACRYPPRGRRSYGPFRATITGRSGAPELEDVACIVMIETADGLANVEEIAKVEGLTALYVGPSDLSIALGLPPASLQEPEFVEALERIRQAAVGAGLVAGMHTHDGEVAAGYLAQGFGMVTVASDMTSLRAAVGRHVDRARAGVPQSAPVVTSPDRPGLVSEGAEG